MTQCCMDNFAETKPFLKVRYIKTVTIICLILYTIQESNKREVILIDYIVFDKVENFDRIGGFSLEGVTKPDQAVIAVCITFPCIQRDKLHLSYR